jgi:hypothetical protein
MREQIRIRRIVCPFNSMSLQPSRVCSWRQMNKLEKKSPNRSQGFQGLRLLLNVSSVCSSSHDDESCFAAEAPRCKQWLACDTSTAPLTKVPSLLTSRACGSQQ